MDGIIAIIILSMCMFVWRRHHWWENLNNQIQMSAGLRWNKMNEPTRKIVPTYVWWKNHTSQLLCKLSQETLTWKWSEKDAANWIESIIIDAWIIVKDSSQRGFNLASSWEANSQTLNDRCDVIFDGWPMCKRPRRNVHWPLSDTFPPGVTRHLVEPIEMIDSTNDPHQTSSFMILTFTGVPVCHRQTAISFV